MSEKQVGRNRRTVRAFSSCMAAGLAAVLGLAGCEDQSHYKDTLYMPISVETGLIPSPDTYNGDKEASVHHAAPIYRDQTVYSNIYGAGALVNYVRALSQSGLLAQLNGAGPFTVFAVPNAAMEQNLAAQITRKNDPQLRRAMAYTIVSGSFPEARLKAEIQKNKGNPIGLYTIDGQVLGVYLDRATGQLGLSNGSGQRNEIWVHGFPSANGVLYVTRSFLAPAAGRPASLPSVLLSEPLPQLQQAQAPKPAAVPPKAKTPAGGAAVQSQPLAAPPSAVTKPSGPTILIH